MALRLEYRHETPTLVDDAGGRWWPTHEAAVAIRSRSLSEHQGSSEWGAAEAEAIAQERAGNGEWRT